MDIAVTRTRNLILAATLAVVLLGLGASYLTWQNVNRQRALVREHMAHTGQVMFRSVESATMREMRGEILELLSVMRAPRDPSILAKLKEKTKDLLDELVQDKDIDFLAIYSPDRELLMFSSDEDGEPAYDIPETAWRSMERRGISIVVDKYAGNEVMVVLSESRPPLASFTGLMPESGMRGMHGGMQQGRGMQGRGGMRMLQSGAEPYLVLGMDVRQYMSAYKNFERNAYFQTGYVVVAGLMLWGLALAYISRRERSLAYDKLENFHSRLLDTMPDGLLTVDAHGVVRAANPAAVRLLVDEGEDLAGRRWDDLGLVKKDAPSNGTDRSGIERGQFESVGRTLEILSRPIPDIGEEAADQRLVLVRDRTKVAALERELAQAEKLAAVGRLAAGLAHEIRNPLSSLRGFAQYFQERFKGQEEVEEYAGIMVSESDRLNRVVTDLLFLAKPRPLSRQETNLSNLATELTRLLERDAEKKSATLSTDIKAETVLADTDQIKQALLNLLLNSLVATPDEGGEIMIFSESRDGEIRVGVTDNGSGMTPEEVENAMEPFFTGRADGTGLGLAVVHKIMRDHGGRVDIESEKGCGATVTLVFPRNEDQSASEEPVNEEDEG